MSLKFEVWQEGKAERWRWRLAVRGRVLAVSGLWYTRKQRASDAARHLIKILSRADPDLVSIHFLIGRAPPPKKIASTPHTPHAQRRTRARAQEEKEQTQQPEQQPNLFSSAEVPLSIKLAVGGLDKSSPSPAPTPPTIPSIGSSLLSLDNKKKK